MQCVSCQFYNVPGSAACGRCGTTLRFDRLAVSVTPPRAPRRGRWLRTVGLTWLNRGREAGRSAREATSGHSTSLLGDDAPPALLFTYMLVPGWALRRVGAVAVGWAALAAWVSLLALAVLFMGWQLGGLFLGLAFTVHYVSGLAAARLAGFDRVYTFRVGALIAVILLAAFYVPVPWLVQQVVRPVEVARPAGPFHAGDVILYRPLAGATDLPVGRWVVFEVPEAFSVPVGRRDQFVNVARGTYLTQVLARPGDRVQWDGKVLTVNGDPAGWQPTGGRAGGKPQTLTVPAGGYFVAPWIPDVVEYNNPNYPSLNTAGPLSLTDPGLSVAAADVRGRVVFKLHPLSELGLVR